MSKKDNIVFHKVYDGFEDAVDLERDVSEMWDDSDLPGEWQGKLVVYITYEPEVDNE